MIIDGYTSELLIDRAIGGTTLDEGVKALQDVFVDHDQAEKGEPMSEIVREMTREELVALNNELRAENEKLKADIHEARLAAEHNRHVAEENQLKYELHYRDGVIYGMKYALKCNGVSGGEVD